MPLSNVQSNGLPSPPGRVASCGARASKISRSATLAYIADRRKVGALGDRQRLHHRQAETAAHDRDPLRRLVAVQLQHVGLEGVDDVAERLVVGIDRERDLAGAASARAPRACARASSPRLRGLGAKNTKPTRSAPESSATSSASGVFRPQILIDQRHWRRVLPPSPPRRKAEPPPALRNWRRNDCVAGCGSGMPAAVRPRKAAADCVQLLVQARARRHRAGGRRAATCPGRSRRQCRRSARRGSAP